ncbi:hypothetical protein SAMN05216207_100375 [Pseudonocardia ammonioxydans]|uniref:Uncharacterized protein n=1 Tax=Pseudonocardia ammonioxydans TaxID=260086 RepID=A0A1I4TYL4_PSUAM|nr:hypothetical protein [Pseudonocardia ammonioxydans]SFM81665.1 hypothetical protein SAMN05216207_100375 [Pseudonocardia ammonioxydans]
MTRTFLPLVTAQAKARRVDPRVVVVEHPVGGLDPSGLEGRIASAYAGIAHALDELEEAM